MANNTKDPTWIVDTSGGGNIITSKNFKLASIQFINNDASQSTFIVPDSSGDTIFEEVVAGNDSKKLYLGGKWYDGIGNITVPANGKILLHVM